MLPAAAAALVAGQLLARHAGSASWAWLGLAGLAGIWAARLPSVRARGLLATFALAGVLMVIGLRQGDRFLRPACAPEAPCALTLPGRAVIEGWVATDPVVQGADVRFDFAVAAVRQREGWGSLHGGIRMRVYGAGGAWRVGDCLRLEASLRAPRNFGSPGVFDYTSYLRSRGISVTGSVWPGDTIEPCERQQPWPRPWIAAARRRVAAVIEEATAPASSGLIGALVLGDRSRVSRETEAAFSRAGVAHVLSISGLHFAVVAGAAFTALRHLAALHPGVLARGLAPRLAAAGAVPVALGYGALAGAQIPTLRSMVMAAVYFGGVIGHRRPEVLRSLALAALVVSAWWPGAVFEATFALSFVAVLGVVLGLRSIGPRGPASDGTSLAPAAAGAGRESLPSKIAARAVRALHGSLAVSIGAGLSTAPLTALHFNMVSLIGPMANLVVVPLLSGATVVGLVGAAAGMLSPAAGHLVLGVGVALADAGAQITGLAASVPAAAVRVVTPTGLEMGLFYALLGCAVAWRRSWARLVAAVVVIVAFTDAGYWLRQRYARPSLRVTFLDVGQGDAAVVEFPGSAVLVVDGGGFPRTDFDPGEAVVASYLWGSKIGRVDFVAVSHADLDHAGGLGFVIEEFKPREFWWNGHREPGEALSKLLERVAHAGSGQRLLDGDAASWQVGPVDVRVLHPPRAARGTGRSGGRGSRNDDSLVFRLRWGATSVLFTGDIETAAERELLTSADAALGSAVLKVPHHGSRTSSGPGFLAAVDPAVAIISVGAGNRYGLPAPEVRRRYHDQGVCVRRTDEIGAITVEGGVDGYRVTPPCPVAPAGGAAAGSP